MSALVLDASVAASWLLDDEMDPLAALVSAQVVEDGAVVPQLWHLEARIALIVAERRGRISPDGLNERVRALLDMPVRTDTEPDLDAALALARAHGLSLYDAIYLELAQRYQTAVATLDGRLVKAVAAEGLSLVG